MNKAAGGKIVRIRVIIRTLRANLVEKRDVFCLKNSFMNFFQTTAAKRN